MSVVFLTRPPYIVEAGPFPGVYTSPEAYTEHCKWKGIDHARVIETRPVGEYLISGNDFLAIAINTNNPQDAHWFTPGRADPNYEQTFMTAWERAEAWASPGT